MIRGGAGGGLLSRRPGDPRRPHEPHALPPPRGIPRLPAPAQRRSSRTLEVMNSNPRQHVAAPEHPASVISGSEAVVQPVSAWVVVSGAVIAIVLGLWMVFDTSGFLTPRGTSAAPTEPAAVTIIAEPAVDDIVPAAPSVAEAPVAGNAPIERASTEAVSATTSGPDAAPNALADQPDPMMLEAFAEGKRLLAVGRHAEAVRALRLAVALDPSYAPAHYRLGLAYLMSGRREAARAQLKKLERLDSSRASLLENLLR